jgi:hypothetical protein
MQTVRRKLNECAELGELRALRAAEIGSGSFFTSVRDDDLAAGTEFAHHKIVLLGGGVTCRENRIVLAHQVHDLSNSFEQVAFIIHDLLARH